MKDISTEVAKDIVSALKIMIEFSKIDNTVQVPLDILNYSSLKKAKFGYDWAMVQAVSESIVSKSSELISETDLDNRKLIIKMFEDNSYEQFIFEMHGEYLDTLTLSQLDALYDSNEGEYLIDEGFLEFLSCMGIRCLSIKVPFVTEINKTTSRFLDHIPYLLQWKYRLSSCFFINHHMQMNYCFNCAQIDIFYIESSECDFLDDKDIDNLSVDFINFINDEMVRRDINVRDK